MYKLIAIDLDGTLLNNNKEISQRNMQAIALAKNKCVRVIVCSGRVYMGARLFAKQLDLTDPIIACNGAKISQNKDGKELFAQHICKEACLEIIDLCHKHNVYYHIYADDIMLSEKMEFATLKYYERNKQLMPEDRVEIEIVADMKQKILTMQQNVLKFVIISQNDDVLAKIRREAHLISQVDVMSSNYDNFEIVDKGVSKGEALKFLSKELGIAPEEMIAIGDNENDISMLNYAGLGIAMGNGEQCAKDIAQYITASNEEDGVALAIEKFIL